MEFTEFAHLLKPIIGGSYNTHLFTRTLFESIIADNDDRLIEDISENTFKAYYNGQTKITKIAQRILPHIDPEQFSTYLDGFPDATVQRLFDAFSPHIEEMTLFNVSEKIAYYFENILTVAASQKRKSTPKSAKNNNDIKVPEIQITEDTPFSPEDINLLKEFSSYYDEIMLVIIDDNYGASLIDMTLPNKIKDLYTSKWNTKAEAFSDLTLKSNVYALLGELNRLSESFLVDNCESFFIRQSRLKIRNLYVKLHPDSFSATFPYDAFIDDWDEGEF